MKYDRRMNWVNVCQNKLLSLNNSWAAAHFKRKEVAATRSRKSTRMAGAAACASRQPQWLAQTSQSAEEAFLRRVPVRDIRVRHFRHRSSSRRPRRLPLRLLFLLHTSFSNGLCSLSELPLKWKRRPQMNRRWPQVRQVDIPSWAEWLLEWGKIIKIIKTT